ncbi:MAG: hypothetical protein ACE5GM_03135 [bacterium]
MKQGIDVSGYFQPESDFQEVWFDFLEKSKIKLRYLSPKKLREIRREAVRREFREGRVEETVDEERFLERLTEEVILDWEGFLDDRGRPIPCTADNKRMLMENWGEFSLFIQNVSVNLEEYRRAKREGERKN